MKTITIAIAAALLMIGCGGGETSSQDDAKSAAKSVVESAENAARAQTETAAVTLAGTLGCGHCKHHIGEGCSAALETAEGKVYILENMEAGSAPFDGRFGGGEITVVGTVAERDGVNYVQVASFEL